MNQVIALVAGLLGAGGVTGLLGLWMGRRQANSSANLTDASATEVVTQAAERVMARYEQDNTRLRQRVELLERQTARIPGLERDVANLQRQVIDLGHQPIVNGNTHE